MILRAREGREFGSDTRMSDKSCTVGGKEVWWKHRISESSAGARKNKWDRLQGAFGEKGGTPIGPG